MDDEILKDAKEVEEELKREENNNSNNNSKNVKDDSGLNAKLFSVIVVFMIIVLSVYFLLSSFNFNFFNSNKDNVFHYGVYTFNYDPKTKLYSLDYQKDYYNGSVIYKVDFSYLPQNLTDIKVYGSFSGLKNNFSMSFQPDMNDSNLAHARVAMLDAARKFIGLYKQYPKVFCTDSSLDSNCPVLNVTCDNNFSALVFYESNDSRIVFKNDCVEFYGNDNDFEKMENLFFYYVLGIVKFK